GDDQPDAELMECSTLGREQVHRLWRYCIEGGPENALQLLHYAESLLGGVPQGKGWREPLPLLRAGLYWPGLHLPSQEDVARHWQAGRPAAALVFYRALLQAGNLAVVDALITALDRAGLNPLALYVTSLKEPAAADLVAAAVERAKPAVILNATSFALSSPGAEQSATPFDDADVPVLQVVFSGGGETEWRAGSQGLSARDLAMQVALPEVDGRI